MSKYEMLTNVLEKIRLEAPSKQKKYHNIEKTEDENHIKSLCYIHLFLKAYFNLSDFEERERYIVDGPYDGGIDAYYIDRYNKNIYFVQSKFRNTENNFENKVISIEELVKMEIDRVLEGEKKDENGNTYNGKINKMQEKINNLDGLPRYHYKVIILANVKSNIIEENLKRLIGNYESNIIDYNVAYESLLFPVLRGTCHMAEDITVNLSMDGKKSSTMDYDVQIDGIESSVQLFFIPTIEIAKLMSEYKNSVLEYNPRSFLGVSKKNNSNGVNEQIRNSIMKKNQMNFLYLIMELHFCQMKLPYRQELENLGKLNCS